MNIRTHASGLLAAVLLVSVLAGCAGPRGHHPQLEAERMYNGIGRSVWVRVPCVPDPAVAMLEPVSNRAVVTAPCSSGRVDLAEIIPGLWDRAPGGVLYAQLTSGGRPVGAPLVIQPMTSPPTAVLVEPSSGKSFWVDDATKTPSFPARDGVVRYYHESPVVCSGCRIYREQRVIVSTSLGEMAFAMRPDAAPNTAINFVNLAANGYYTDTIVHRVVAKGRDGSPFVVQFGDPTGTGDGTPGYAIDLEPTTLKHDFGVISMARDSDPNTNGSQVFVCLSREGTARLDGKYGAFGEMVAGADVLRAIAAVPVTEGTDRPLDPPVVKRVCVIDAPPRVPAQ